MTGQVANTISQGILAKLLASENITVHVGNYTTAFFDVKNRILGLPSWNVENKSVSDLLIGHEVGHALWTPADGIEKFKTELKHIPFHILNIVEDIRIERMIQDRYPGLISSFNQGYEHFLKNNFFGILGKDVSKMNFADRLNIKAKLRHLIDVPFSDDEQAIFDRALKAETFEDVVAIVQDAYDLVKREPEPEPADDEEEVEYVEDENAPINPSAQSEPSEKKSKKSKDKESDDSDSEEKDTKEAPKTKKETKKESEKEPEDKSSDSDDEDSGESDSDSDSEKDDNEEADTASGEGEESSDIGSASDEEGEDKESETDGNSGPESDADDSDDGDESDSETEAEGGDDDQDEDGPARAGRSQLGANRVTGKVKQDKKEKYKSPEEELTSSTLDSLNDELNNLHTDFGHTRPIMVPSAEQMNCCVTPWKKVFAGRQRYPENYNSNFLLNSEVKADWIEYKKNVKKHIQNLVTDFERRKAAFQYSRAQVSDAGDIDVNRLHAYKFDDQIFRSITKLADCKNHGMMFFIDYSGSMANDIFNVLDHTLNLVTFCNTVGIPFQVFGFTNSNRIEEDAEGNVNRSAIPHNQLSLDNVNIFELLSSAMKPKEMELGMRHIRAQIFHGSRCEYNYGISLASPWEVMSGTPLNETMIVAHDLVAKFRRKYHVQKMNVLILSDGEGQGFRMGGDDENAEHIKKDSGRVNRYVMQLHGREIHLAQYDSNRNYATLVENLKETLGCTMIGFFISRTKKDLRLSAINSIRFSAKHGFNRETQGDWATASALTEKEASTFRKNRCMFVSGGFNFDCYFLVDSRDAKIGNEDSFNSKIDEKEFEGSISASAQNKLAREFTKFAGDKKSSRIILNKFAEIIA